VDSFWRHSVAVGLAARLLASARKDLVIENYFIAGVLHDIGRLVMLQKMPEPYRKVIERCRMSGEMVFNVEREVFGYDHADVGATLLQHWNLSQMLVEAVASHHNPQSAERHPMFAAITHIADILAHALQLGANGERHVPRLSPGAWTRFGMQPAVLPTVMDQLDSQYREMVELIVGPNPK
jgi:putative nucleotidyltransferase with HDIG domain